jgi:rod shape-determining protein MreC
VATLLHHNVMLQSEQHENQLLHRMLRYDDANGHMSMLVANVIGNDPSSRDYILINRGSRDGVRTGMTVVDQGGFFTGSIVDTTSNAAKVLLMLSPSSSVGAIDLTTRASGLVEGRYGNRPQFRWVTSNATIHRGDWIVTSGQLNLFPRTLLLGQVTRVRHSNVAIFQTADIQPAADFQHLELVQVVRSFVPSVPGKLVGTP